MSEMTPVSGAIHVIKHGWPVHPANRTSAAQAILDSLFSKEFSIVSEIQEIIDEEKQVRPATTVGDFFHLMEEMVKIGEVTQAQLDFIHGVLGKNPNENLSLAAFYYAALAKQANARSFDDKDRQVNIDVAISWIDEYVKYNTWREQVSAALAKE